MLIRMSEWAEANVSIPVGFCAGLSKYLIISPKCKNAENEVVTGGSKEGTQKCEEQQKGKTTKFGLSASSILALLLICFCQKVPGILFLFCWRKRKSTLSGEWSLLLWESCFSVRQTQNYFEIISIASEFIWYRSKMNELNPPIVAV